MSLFASIKRRFVRAQPPPRGTRLYRVEPLDRHHCEYEYWLGRVDEVRIMRAPDALRAVEDFYDSMQFKTHRTFSVRVEQTREQLVVEKFGIEPARLKART